MSMILTDCVNPWKAADRSLSVSGAISLQSLQRLAVSLVENSGDVLAALKFERNADNLPVLQGTIETTLRLECQRCLLPMDFPVKTPLNIAFIHDTANQDSHSERFEIIEVVEDEICLADIIEDELLLFLPQVPMHTAPACVIETQFGDTFPEETVKEKENPFAVLELLKSQRDN